MSSDVVTGLYFFGTRFYDPTIGRFVQMDTFAGSLADPLSLNRYAYANDNPATVADPTGFGGGGYGGKCTSWSTCYANPSNRNYDDPVSNWWNSLTPTQQGLTIAAVIIVVGVTTAGIAPSLGIALYGSTQVFWVSAAVDYASVVVAGAGVGAAAYTSVYVATSSSINPQGVIGAAAGGAQAGVLAGAALLGGASILGFVGSTGTEAASWAAMGAAQVAASAANKAISIGLERRPVGSSTCAAKTLALAVFGPVVGGVTDMIFSPGAFSDYASATISQGFQSEC